MSKTVHIMEEPPEDELEFSDEDFGPEDEDFDEDDPFPEEDFIDDDISSLPSFDSEDDKRFFDDEDLDDSFFDDSAFDEFDELCDGISEPPESPPESPTEFDDDDFDDMSFFSDEVPPEEDWPSFSSDEGEFDDEDEPGPESEDEFPDGEVVATETVKQTAAASEPQFIRYPIPKRIPQPETVLSSGTTVNGTAKDTDSSTGCCGQGSLGHSPPKQSHTITTDNTTEIPTSTETAQGGVGSLSLPPPPPPPPAVVAKSVPPITTTTTAGGGDAQQPMVPIAEHPGYSKYYKMLKYGLPLTAVKTKMNHDGFDSAKLDLPPTECIPAGTVVPKFVSASVAAATSGASTSAVEEEEDDDGGEKVTYAEHVTYGKYFKMVKFGLSKDAVKGKITQEGFNPDVIDKLPTDLVSAKPGKPFVTPKGRPLGGRFEMVLRRKTTAEPTEPAVRKKKLFWKGMDNSKIADNEDSLWRTTEDDSEIALDQEEFNRLFTEKTEVKGAAAAATETVKPKKPKGIHLIDLKRAQNAAIALSRIKIPFDELRSKLMRLDDANLTTDQLVSLCEYLPTAEETKILERYTGDVTLLGQAEKYMLAMLHFPSATQRIGCMVYKQLFANRQQECKVKLQKIETACDDVKLSGRLKKVLKIILKVGNTLNDNADNKGFSVDSLLKLKDAKAFDKKTSILQYVIILIHRNDADALLFPQDLPHIADASRLIMDAIGSDKNALRSEFDANCRLVTSIQTNEPELKIDAAVEFYTSKAAQQCEDLDKRFQKVKAKFSNVLSYFGEDPAMNSTDFFTTLNKFILEFVATRDNVERLRKMEERKKKAMSMPKVKLSSNLGRAADGETSSGGADAGAGGGGGRSKVLKRSSTVATMESVPSVSDATEEVLS